MTQRLWPRGAGPQAVSRAPDGGAGALAFSPPALAGPRGLIGFPRVSGVGGSVLRGRVFGVRGWSAAWLAVAAVAVGVLGAPPGAWAATSASFAASVEYPTDHGSQVGSGPIWVAVGDFNGDGHADLVTVSNNAPATASVLLGRGDGTFRARVDYAAGASDSFPSSVAVGDFNHDGHPDLAVTEYYTPTTGQVGYRRSVAVLLGRGDGTFAPPVEYPTGLGPTSVVVGDLNGDGNPDLVTSDLGSNSVSVLLGRGDGTFAPNSDYPTGGGPNDLALGDFNRDGSLDVVTADADGNVAVLLGNPNGTLALRSDYAAGLGKPNIRYARPYGVAVGDFNGDHNPDVGVATSGTDSGGFKAVSVLLGRGDGTLGPMSAYEADHYYEGPIKVAVGDFNGDGHPDLAVADQGGAAGGASVLPGNGDGTFAPRTEYPTNGYSQSVAVGDFNEDGRPDLALAKPGNNTVAVLLNTTTPAGGPGGGGNPPPAGGGGSPPPGGGSNPPPGGGSSPPPGGGSSPPPGGGGNPPPGGGGAGRHTTAPVVSGFGLTNNPFVVGGSTPIFGTAAAKNTKKHKLGTTLRYTLSEAATVRIVITQARSGRRRGKRCVAPTRSLRRARKCTRTLTRGTLTRTSHQGKNRVAFSGRIGSRKLAPGRYQATLTATDPAKITSKPRTITFMIVRR